MKTHPIVSMLKRRFPGQAIINVTGIRRSESRKRAHSPIAERDQSGRIWSWRPILDWCEDDVFACIARHGLQAHPAYRLFLMSRVSCRFYIMSSLSDLRAAARQEETHELCRRLVLLEIRSSFAFQRARWLGDIASDLLDAMVATGLKLRKPVRARMEAERQLTPAMLYVQGRPTRMLADEEVDTLASVRRSVTNLWGFQSRCLDRTSIHDRYATLLAVRATRSEAPRRRRGTR